MFLAHNVLFWQKCCSSLCRPSGNLRVSCWAPLNHSHQRWIECISLSWARMKNSLLKFIKRENLGCAHLKHSRRLWIERDREVRAKLQCSLLTLIDVGASWRGTLGHIDMVLYCRLSMPAANTIYHGRRMMWELQCGRCWTSLKFNFSAEQMSKSSGDYNVMRFCPCRSIRQQHDAKLKSKVGKKIIIIRSPNLLIYNLILKSGEL